MSPNIASAPPSASPAIAKPATTITASTDCATEPTQGAPLALVRAKLAGMTPSRPSE